MGCIQMEAIVLLITLIATGENFRFPITTTATEKDAIPRPQRAQYMLKVEFNIRFDVEILLEVVIDISGPI